jgi:hypothetical protein
MRGMGIAPNFPPPCRSMASPERGFCGGQPHITIRHKTLSTFRRSSPVLLFRPVVRAFVRSRRVLDKSEPLVELVHIGSHNDGLVDAGRALGDHTRLHKLRPPRFTGTISRHGRLRNINPTLRSVMLRLPIAAVTWDAVTSAPGLRHSAKRSIRVAALIWLMVATPA